MDFASALFHGGGSVDATTCTLAGLEYLIQDDDMYTVDSYRLVVRRAVAPNGLPDGAATGVIMRTGAIQLNDVFVDDRGIVFTVDRFAGGLYALEMTI